MTREQLFDFMKQKYPLLNEKRLKQVISELPNDIPISDIFDFMKDKYPLLNEKRLKQAISELPKEIIMGDHYITAKEFRKLNLVTELLTEKYLRNKIKWYCEKDGWSLLIDTGYEIINVYLTCELIQKKSVTEIINIILDNA